MKVLTLNIYNLISRGINAHGTYDPAVISYMFEEELTFKEYTAVTAFLSWCHATGKLFGRGNYAERYQEYLNNK